MIERQPPPRQTLTYLRRLCEDHGLRPRGKLGQCFLIDLNILDLIVRTAELSHEDLVLEVGSGTGSLTSLLAGKSGSVVSIEVDPGFFHLASETVAGQSNVTLIQGDILLRKNELNPEVLSALRENLGHGECSRLKLVANLPYVVATPVISNLLLELLPIERMVVTVQDEIALRLCGRPGTSDYGALAVLIQSVADVQIVRRLPPSVFWPRPQVSSAIVLIRPDAAKRKQVGNVARFRHFLRDLYVHRRKNLRSALASLPSRRRDKREVDRMLSEMGVEGTARAEDLDIEQHLQLSAMFG
jgi:16S rRNA (adenine1518-N6/adenine1519-N6)-dimethyltransferase